MLEKNGESSKTNLTFLARAKQLLTAKSLGVKLGHALAESTIFWTVVLFVSEAHDCFMYIAGVLYKVGNLGKNHVHVFCTLMYSMYFDT